MTQSLWITAFSTPRIQEALDLNDNQKARIHQIETQFKQALEKEISKVAFDDVKARAAVLKTMIEKSKAVEASVIGVLTDKQKAIWKDLTGDPYLFAF